jgi:hypothetical protein
LRRTSSCSRLEGGEKGRAGQPSDWRAGRKRGKRTIDRSVVRQEEEDGNEGDVKEGYDGAELAEPVRKSPVSDGEMLTASEEDEGNGDEVREHVACIKNRQLYEERRKGGQSRGDEPMVVSWKKERKTVGEPR